MRWSVHALKRLSFQSVCPVNVEYFVLHKPSGWETRGTRRTTCYPMARWIEGHSPIPSSVEHPRALQRIRNDFRRVTCIYLEKHTTQTGPSGTGVRDEFCRCKFFQQRHHISRNKFWMEIQGLKKLTQEKNRKGFKEIGSDELGAQYKPPWEK